MITDCNVDRMFQLIESVFHLAHVDAHRGDPDALDFLQCYGIQQPQPQGHRVLATNKRPRRTHLIQLTPQSGAVVKV